MCDATIGCVCDDDCNQCTFFPYCDGFAKTDRYCPTPYPHCTSATDCPQGSLCSFDPGCAAASGICVLGPRYGHAVITICDCDGNTVVVERGPFVTQPYRQVGACPSDQT
jgi:hypothetical protein